MREPDYRFSVRTLQRQIMSDWSRLRNATAYRNPRSHSTRELRRDILSCAAAIRLLRKAQKEAGRG